MDAIEFQLDDIVESVASSFLGTDAHAMPSPPADKAAQGAPWAGCVTVGGVWNGAVTVACDHELLRRAASKVFQTPLDAVTDEDSVDTLGEITNMIGGNFKSLVASEANGHCVLSIPVVARTPISVPNSVLLQRIFFDCEGATLCVSVWKADDGKSAGEGFRSRGNGHEGTDR